MTFTIPHTRYTRGIVVGFNRRGVIIAFIWNLGVATAGDEVHFFNRNGYSVAVYGGG